MNKLLTTTLVLVFAIATAATAASTTSARTSTSATTGAAATQTTAQATDLSAAEPAAGKKGKHKHMRHHRHHTGKKAVVAENTETTPYTEMRVGDPRIVYHEIGTSGAQNGNTIVPFHDEPIRSTKPYEIRYDYAEFRNDEDNNK